jgi:hypothetical protein
MNAGLVRERVFRIAALQEFIRIPTLTVKTNTHIVVTESQALDADFNRGIRSGATQGRGRSVRINIRHNGHGRTMVADAIGIITELYASHPPARRLVSPESDIT